MNATKQKREYRKWTPEEEEKLRVLSEKFTKRDIAKRLKRSVASVSTKRKNMGIPCFVEQTELLTGVVISELVGAHSTSIYKTWVNNGLELKKIGGYKVTDEKTLVKFMQERPDLWKASECDYYFFCRYKWFTDRLERERAGIDKGNRYTNTRRWTETEISRAKMLKRRGLSHRQIGAELGRTKQAIDHLSMKGII